MRLVLPMIALSLAAALPARAEPLAESALWRLERLESGAVRAEGLASGDTYEADQALMIPAEGPPRGALLLRRAGERYRLLALRLESPFPVGAAAARHSCDALTLERVDIENGALRAHIACKRKKDGSIMPLKVPVPIFTDLPWAESAP